MSKSLVFIVFWTTFMLLTACEDQQWQRSIEENNFNLPKPTPTNVLDLKVDISSAFSYAPYLDRYAYAEKDTDVATFEANTAIHLGIVKYTRQEIQNLTEATDNMSASDLEKLHRYTVHKRCHATRNRLLVSEPQKLLERTKKKGLLQTLIPNMDNNLNRYEDYYYVPNNHFLIATIAHKNNYYVFQFSANEEIMSYMFDDFLAMIQSVR